MEKKKRKPKKKYANNKKLLERKRINPKTVLLHKEIYETYCEMKKYDLENLPDLAPHYIKEEYYYSKLVKMFSRTKNYICSIISEIKHNKEEFNKLYEEKKIDINNLKFDE